MDQPERLDVFEVGVDSFGAEQHRAQRRDVLPAKAARIVRGRINDPRRQRPMADGPHHVLPHPERDHGVVAGEERRVRGDRVDALLQPPVAQREALVPREGHDLRRHRATLPRNTDGTLCDDWDDGQCAK